MWQPPPVLFTYKPGQFVTINLEIDGEEILRSYSISSTPSRPHTLDITIKRVPASGLDPNIPPGKVSNWMHDNIKVGSEIEITGPLGKFTCFANPSNKLLFISAGSGITPMMSMSRWIVDTASNCDVVFFHSARSPRDIIFRQELELMAARNPNFHLKITTTRDEPGQSWLGLTGRLNPSMLEMIAPDFQERTVYVCGPNAFMEEVKNMLEGLDFPMNNYYEESFGSPKKKSSASALKSSPVAKQRQSHGLGAKLMTIVPPEDDTTTYSPEGTPLPQSQPKPSVASHSVVIFSKSGKECKADEEQSILDLAEQEGVKIRYSCRSGTCGSCKKRKLEGEVKMGEFDPEALEDTELQEGYILTCISYPIGKVVIDA